MPTTRPVRAVTPGEADDTSTETSTGTSTGTRGSTAHAKVTAEVAVENAHWVRDLSGTGARHDDAVDRLYAILVKMAYTEARRKGSRIQLAGSELDDIAHQAAADATMTICNKVTTFRGDCRFTTWAFRFVQFDVSSKVNRHFWQRATVSIDDNDWAIWNAISDSNPAAQAEGSDLLNAITKIISAELTDRQQHTFEAIAIRGISVSQVASEMNSNPNAIYKVMFDARRKLRIGLATAGYPVG